jgi:hypothetical protein
MSNIKKLPFAHYREDGEPGVTIIAKIEKLPEPKHFDTIVEGAEFLGMEPNDLLDYLESDPQ